MTEYSRTHGEDALTSTDLRRAFLDGLPGSITVLRQSLQQLLRAENGAARVQHLATIHEHVRTVAASAANTDLAQVRQLLGIFEALLQDLAEIPDSLNASTSRTLATTIDFLGRLAQRGHRLNAQSTPAEDILVVDDEIISRRAVVLALQKAGLKSVSVDHPDQAYALLAKTRFALIFLDVDMPGMNGFALCSKIRELPAHRKTPIIFVTGLADFESRANSTISGGNDVIAKPFLLLELALKALVFLLQSRLDQDVFDIPKPAH